MSALIRPSRKRWSTANATGRGSQGKTSDPASSNPRPSRRRRLATPAHVHPGQPAPSPSERKSSLRDHAPRASASPVLWSASPAPAAAPAASSSRRLTPWPSMAADYVGAEGLALRFPRRVAVVEQQRIAVGVGEERHVAHAGVEYVPAELDA